MVYFGFAFILFCMLLRLTVDSFFSLRLAVENLWYLLELLLPSSMSSSSESPLSELRIPTISLPSASSFLDYFFFWSTFISSSYFLMVRYCFYSSSNFFLSCSFFTCSSSSLLSRFSGCSSCISSLSLLLAEFFAVEDGACFVAEKSHFALFAAEFADSKFWSRAHLIESSYYLLCLKVLPTHAVCAETTLVKWQFLESPSILDSLNENTLLIVWFYLGE